MPILFLLLVLFCGPQSWGQDFNEGIKAYQAGEYEEASKVFFELSKQHPSHPAVIYNLGLSSYNMGRKGLALGLWRKAQHLQPSDKTQQAILYAEEELGMATSNDGFLPTVMAWLGGFSASFYLALTTLLLLAIGWPASTYFAKRKLPLGQWPSWIFAMIPLWILMVCLSIWQIIAESESFGTIVEVDVSTRTGPSLDSPTLTSLDEGSLVRIIKAYENWYQVQSTSGAPGWILKEKIIPEKGPLE